MDFLIAGGSLMAGVALAGLWIFSDVGKRLKHLETCQENLYENDLRNLDRWDDLRADMDDLHQLTASLEIDVAALLEDPFEEVVAKDQVVS